MATSRRRAVMAGAWLGGMLLLGGAASASPADPLPERGGYGPVGALGDLASPADPPGGAPAPLGRYAQLGALGLIGLVWASRRLIP